MRIHGSQDWQMLTKGMSKAAAELGSVVAWNMSQCNMSWNAHAHNHRDVIKKTNIVTSCHTKERMIPLEDPCHIDGATD